LWRREGSLVKYRRKKKSSFSSLGSGRAGRRAAKGRYFNTPPRAIVSKHKPLDKGEARDLPGVHNTLERGLTRRKNQEWCLMVGGGGLSATTVQTKSGDCIAGSSTVVGGKTGGVRRAVTAPAPLATGLNFPSRIRSIGGGGCVGGRTCLGGGVKRTYWRIQTYHGRLRPTTEIWLRRRCGISPHGHRGRQGMGGALKRPAAKRRGGEMGERRKPLTRRRSLPWF